MPALSPRLGGAALLVALSLPVAAQAPPPPVTFAAAPAAAYTRTTVQATPAVVFTDCLTTNTDYAVAVTANVQLTAPYAGTFTARTSAGYTVGFDPAAVSGMAPQVFPTTVTLHTPATPTTEQRTVFIDLAGISRIPAGPGAPPADETSLVVVVPCLTDAAAPRLPGTGAADDGLLGLLAAGAALLASAGYRLRRREQRG